MSESHNQLCLAVDTEANLSYFSSTLFFDYVHTRLIDRLQQIIRLIAVLKCLWGIFYFMRNTHNKTIGLLILCLNHHRFGLNVVAQHY